MTAQTQPFASISRSAIERLLNPRSIALAGVSSTPGSLAGIVLENLERFAYQGDIHLIHPKQTELRGRRCIASFNDLPMGVDCVVLAIPVGGVIEAAKRCAARGVGGLVIFSAGFAELSPEGKLLQEQLADIAKTAGMVIAGPNCLGFVNYVDGVPLTFAIVEPRPITRPAIAVVSQSGAMASVMRAALHGRRLELTSFISTGNEALNGIEDFIEHALHSTHTRMIVVMAEHIRQPQRFLSLAREARGRDMVIALLHPGRSAAARHSAATHTGAMAGDHAVMRTLVENAGVLFVDTLEELVDLADCVTRCAKRPYGGSAQLCESGAFKALALDYCEALGLTLPELSGMQADAINKLAPGLIVSSNPLDLTTLPMAKPELYDQAAGLMLADKHCGSLMITIVLTSAQMAARKMPPVIAAIRKWAQTHTVVFAMLGEDTPLPDALIDEVHAAGAPFFRSPERALRALARYTQWANNNAGAVQPHAAVISDKRLPSGVIAEYAAKDVLQAAGIPMGKRQLVTSQEQAVVAANEIGYPVVLKIQSADISHKSDIGGVVLNLGNEQQLLEGWQRLNNNVAAAAPNAKIDGVLLERMSAAGLEMILGGRNDPEWGPVIAIGLGGVLAEAIQDIQLIPATLSAQQITHQLGKLRGARLLSAFRGKPARDIKALVDTIVHLGQFLQAHPEVRELDINPLLVFTEGQGVIAVDALITTL